MSAYTFMFASVAFFLHARYLALHVTFGFLYLDWNLYFLAQFFGENLHITHFLHFTTNATTVAHVFVSLAILSIRGFAA